METLIKIIFLSLLPVLSIAQVEQKKATVTYGAENEVIPTRGDTIFTSNPKSKKFLNGNFFVIEEYYENGNKRKITTFPLENLKYKTVTKYNESGNIILIASYNTGIVTGTFKKFYDTGKIKEEGEYLNMKKTGRWKYYDSEGVLIKTEEN